MRLERITGEIGNVYGHLTVVGLERATGNKRAMWLCVCKCGNSPIVFGKNLRRGLTRSCGCQQYIRQPKSISHGVKIQIGMRFGKLVVQEPIIVNKKLCWKCACDCGGTTTRPSSAFTRKNSPVRQCVCGRSSRRLQAGEAGCNSLFQQYQLHAQERNLAWELSKETFRALTQQICYYCGCNPSQKFRPGTIASTFVYNGVDRLNSSQGYHVSNVVTACKHCNYAKRTRSFADFTSWVQAVFHHLKLGGE